MRNPYSDLINIIFDEFKHIEATEVASICYKMSIAPSKKTPYLLFNIDISS